MGYMSGGVNVKERERETDRETDRRTDGQTDRQTAPEPPPHQTPVATFFRRRSNRPSATGWQPGGGRPPTDERRESGAGLTGFTEKSGARSAARVPRYPQHGSSTRSENG